MPTASEAQRSSTGGPRDSRRGAESPSRRESSTALPSRSGSLFSIPVPASPLNRPGLPRAQKLEYNVHVVARFRPPINAEEQQDSRSFLVGPSGRSVDSADHSYHFELDRAFDEDTSQEEVYDYVGRPVVCDVLDGYNGTIFAYGQTGSGKTYCMFGPESPGVVPRTAEQVFDYIAACADDSREFTLRCSFLEVYKEQMRDLLDPSNQSLKVKELPQRGLYVHGLTREYVTCAGEVMHVVRTGFRARAVARTRVNEHSSRSHAIFMMQVEQRSEEGTERLGKLTLVDLAGSEKVKETGCVGETLEEAKKINVSLSALGKVIDALAEQRSHVPYRDSRLTRVLEEALGGNCRTTLLVAVSPLSQHTDETLSSLRFATRAKAVRNHAKVNYMYSSDQLLVLVSQLQRELASANKQISHFSGKLPESHRERTKDERKKRNENGHDWAKTAQGKMRLRVPLDKLRQSDLADEASADMISPSGDTSCGSARSMASSGTISHSEELGLEAASRDETWRPLALAARDAIRSMEAALLAQEAALQEAGLLPLHPGSSSSAAPAPEQAAPESGAGGPPASAKKTPSRAPTRGESSERRSYATTSPTEGGHDGSATLDNAALAERWRALRHAVDARSLHWRLQAERHKTETLSLELEKRKRQAEDNEEKLEKLSAHLASLMQDGGFNGKDDVLSDSLRRLLPKASAGGSSSSSALNTAQRSGSGRSGPSPAQTSARHARIARPVPRNTSAQGMSNELLRGLSPAASHPASSSGGSPKAKKRSQPDSPELYASKRSQPDSPELCAAGSSPSRRPDRLLLPEAASWPRCPVKRGDRLGSDASSEALFVEDGVLIHNLCKQVSLGSSEDVMPVAGTGEAISSPVSCVIRSSRGGNNSVEMSTQFEALQLSHGELEATVAELQCEVEERHRQLVEFASELGARDVRVSALRHEVRVRDALLEHLHEDLKRRAEHKDHEVERLVEQAMLPLTTILSARQAATAAAIGERSMLVH